VKAHAEPRPSGYDMRGHLSLATPARQAASVSVHEPEPATESTARNPTGVGGARPQHVHNLADVDVFPSAGPGRAAVTNVIGSGNGRPLPPDLRADMESRLGDDFSDVRIHTDEQAAESAAAFSAEAYTVGHEIVFGRGAFAPDSPDGKHRLAHELVHVRQQRLGRVKGESTGTGVSISDPSDAYEQEAETVASRAFVGPAPADAVVAPAPSPPRPSGVLTGPFVVQRQAVAAPLADPVTDPASRGTATSDAGTSDTAKGPAHSNPWLGGLGGMFEPAGGSQSAPAAKAADADLPVPDEPRPEPAAPSPSVAHPPQPVADFGVAAKAAREANRQLLATPVAEAAPVTVPEVPTPGALEPSAGRPATASPPAAAEATGGPGGGLIPVELPEMVAGIAEEFLSLVETDRAGQQLLRAAVDQAVTDLRTEVARQSSEVDSATKESQRAISESVTKARQHAQGAAAGAKARVEKARTEQGARVSGQLEQKKTWARGEVERTAKEAETAAGRRADEAQAVANGGASDIDSAQGRLVAATRQKAAAKSGQANSNSDEPEVARASIQAQRQAAQQVATQTEEEINKAVGASAADLRGGGPQLRAEATKQVAPLIQSIRDQASPLDASVTTAGTKFTTVLDGGAQQARGALDAASKGVMAALSQIERQSHRHLETAAGTTKAGLAQAATEGETRLRTRSDDFVGEAHEQLVAHLEVVSSRPVRRELARQLSSQLRSVLQNGYGMGTADARQVAGRIGGQLSDALKQFHTELAGAAQTAGDESSHAAQSTSWPSSPPRASALSTPRSPRALNRSANSSAPSAPAYCRWSTRPGHESMATRPAYWVTPKPRLAISTSGCSRPCARRARRPSWGASVPGSSTRCVRWAARSSPRVSGSGYWLGSW
jgi:Domain of unknown function (DUF4157)